MKYAVAKLMHTAQRGTEWVLLPRIYATEFEAAQRAKKDSAMFVVPLLWSDR